jgi:anthranilate phosphoribosyltransferase
MADRAGPGPEGGNAHEPAQLAAFLVALRAKGETAAELSGMLDALMDRVIPCPSTGSR